jgi:hypothetical protein
MAVTYHADVKNARMEATRGEVANGTLEILTSGDVLLATFGLDATAGTVTADVWTLEFDADTVAAGAAGTAAKAQIKDSGGTARITGLTVGTSAADVIVSNTNIANGQDVIMTGATITHA